MTPTLEPRGMQFDVDSPPAWYSATLRRDALQRRSVTLLLASIGFAMPVLFVVLRRMAGGLQQPASVGLLVAAGAVGLIYVLATSALTRGIAPPARTAMLTIGLALFAVWAAALSLPGSPLAGLSALWLMVVVATLAAAAEVVLPQIGVGQGRTGKVGIPGRASGTRQPTRHAPSSARPRQEPIAQQARLRTATGTDVIEGWLQLEFAARQRLAVAHLAFCPPFDVPPEVQVSPADAHTAADLRLRVTQVLHGGARLEVKRHDAALPASLRIAFVVQQPGRS